MIIPTWRLRTSLALVSVAIAVPALAEYPKPTPGTATLSDFQFQSGERLPEVRIYYRTLGQPRRDATGKIANAVLILHGTTGSGDNFINDNFAGELFGKGQPLDAEKFYLILPDNLGHGQSSRPSSGLKAKFPRYGYRDMIQAQYRMLTEALKIDHLRLVMGTSMGGMHTWLWGELHPDFMDALMPLASLPTEISGRNRVWRKLVSDAIRNDPAWKNGEYQTQPPSLRTELEMLYFLGSNPVVRQREAPTLRQADAELELFVATRSRSTDANDVLYAIEASWDYQPQGDLGKIRKPLVAINFADDLINPPELGILEREIKRVPKGRAIVVPLSDKTRGHGTHTLAAVWKQYLIELLRATEKTR